MQRYKQCSIKENMFHLFYTVYWLLKSSSDHRVITRKIAKEHKRKIRMAIAIAVKTQSMVDDTNKCENIETLRVYVPYTI